nr:RNA-directed DNA polymerase, eukaryota [Tanacetum cinerariifolium]
DSIEEKESHYSSKNEDKNEELDDFIEKVVEEKITSKFQNDSHHVEEELTGMEAHASSSSKPLGFENIIQEGKFPPPLGFEKDYIQDTKPKLKKESDKEVYSNATTPPGFEEFGKSGKDNGYSGPSARAFKCSTSFGKFKPTKKRLFFYRRNEQDDRDNLVKLESMDLFQKARVRWDVEGDENTKFFHGIINSKRNKQMIKGILQEGTWVTDPLDIKAAFLNFYKDKFSCHDSSVIFLPMFVVNRLSLSDQAHLDSMVNLEEIKNVVWECGSQKAPGPDGITFMFIKKYWDLLHLDIQTFVVNFFSFGSFPPGLNSSLFTLISKVNNPLFIKDFRPISLIGFQYKIVAKFLANRLSKVIDSIISNEQSAFISGRQILDGPLILSEVIDCTWRRWIRAGLTTSRASILINGSHTSEFSIKRGLRQGDPLSPFLFIIVMEGLHIAFRDGLMKNMFRGVSIGSLGIRLSHLFYADDVIIISDWNQNDMDNIIRVLNAFHLVSGLKVNINKSNLYNRLFRLKKNQDCLISDRIDNGSWSWDWSRTLLPGRTQDDLNNLLIDISLLDIKVDRDSPTFILSADNTFSITVARKYLDDCMLHSSLLCTRWYKVLPRKVNIFM